MVKFKLPTLQEDGIILKIFFTILPFFQNPKYNIMKCLNCGNHVHPENEKCLSCNMPIKYYGLVHEVSTVVNKEKINGIQCKNCSGIQSDIKATNCQFCNYPFPVLDSQNKTENSTKGFAWRNVGAGNFHQDISDQPDRKIFNLTSNGYKNRIS